MPPSALRNGSTSMNGGVHQEAAERQYIPHDVPQEARAHLASLSQGAPHEADTHVWLQTIAASWHAQDLIHPHVYHTSLLPSCTLGTMTGANHATRRRTYSAQERTRFAARRTHSRTSQRRSLLEWGRSFGGQSFQRGCERGDAPGIPCTIASLLQLRSPR